MVSMDGKQENGGGEVGKGESFGMLGISRYGSSKY